MKTRLSKIILCLMLLCLESASAQENQALEIVGVGMDNTGVVSAYQSHRFCANPSNVANHRWNYSLRLKDGEYETVCTSTEGTFAIPAVANESQYCQDSNGLLFGIVSLSGTVDGVPVSATRNLALDLKPHILSARIMEAVPCDFDDSFYDAVLEVTYDGSHNVYVYIDQEDYDYRFSYYSHTPDCSQFRLNGIDSSSNAEIHVNVQNQYGSADSVIYLSSKFSESLLSIGNASNDEEAVVFSHGILTVPEQVKSVVVRDIGGMVVFGTTNGGQIDLSFLPKGMYIVTTRSNKSRTCKILI